MPNNKSAKADRKTDFPVLLGASSVAQLDENLDALSNLAFAAEELEAIDRYAVESGIDLWRDVASR